MTTPKRVAWLVGAFFGWIALTYVMSYAMRGVHFSDPRIPDVLAVAITALVQTVLSMTLLFVMLKVGAPRYVVFALIAGVVAVFIGVVLSVWPDGPVPFEDYASTLAEVFIATLAAPLIGLVAVSRLVAPQAHLGADRQAGS